MIEWLYATWGLSSNKPQYLAKIRVDSVFVGEIVQKDFDFRLINNTVQSKIGSRRRFLKVSLWRRDYEGNWEQEHNLSKAFTKNYQKLPFVANQLSQEDFTYDNELEMHWVELGLAQIYTEVEDSRPPSSIEEVLNQPVRPSDYNSYTQRYMNDIEERYGQAAQQQQHPHQMAQQYPQSPMRQHQSGPRLTEQGWEWRGGREAHQINGRCQTCGNNPATFTETSNSNYYECNNCNDTFYVDQLLSSS